AHCGDTPRNPLAYLLEGGADTSRIEAEAAYKTEKAALLQHNWQRFIENTPKKHRLCFHGICTPINTVSAANGFKRALSSPNPARAPV
uniref:hypothetical protein n=1 Tax=Neisseria dentiae TaxID=194197 RepID=UPI0035A1308E